jgi:phage-related protein
MRHFIYNGVNSRDMGVFVRTAERQIIPQARQKSAVVPYRDGEIDFSRLNGRQFYDNALHKVEVCVAPDTLNPSKLAALAALLAPGGPLVFDDAPGVVWDAKCLTPLGIIPQYRANWAVFTLTFSCYPFPRGATLILQNLSNSFEGAGTYFSAPVIEVTGAARDVSVTLNGKSLSISGQTNSLVIDCGEYTVTDGGTSVLDRVSGDFGEVRPGANSAGLTAEEGAFSAGQLGHPASKRSLQEGISAEKTPSEEGAPSAVIRYYPRYLYAGV